MPCYIFECEPITELQRFGAAVLGLYVYHFLWDSILITPIANWFLKNKYITKEKRDKMRESLWKNASVGTFTVLGLYIGRDQDWWMNPNGYYKGWPHETPEIMRWYYMIYLAFWFQSVDFMLNLTNKHYIVKRKDNMEMLLHHFATITLMVFSYFFDLTRVGMCVLMIHEVNDLLLETAKVFVYLEWELLANIFFGTFALAWFVVRWGFYGYNILYSVYFTAFDDIIVPIQQKGSYLGLAAPTWWWFWLVFFLFLGLLFALHIFWGVLIVKMVAKTLQAGNVEKDIRSDSEAEDEDADDKPEPAAAPSSTDGKAKPRRRAPKADIPLDIVFGRLAPSTESPTLDTNTMANGTLSNGFMTPSYAQQAPAVSTHFVGESARAVCFLKDARVADASIDDRGEAELLPLIAVGDDDALALYLPVVSTPDEDFLREELNNTGRKPQGRSQGGVELNSVAEIAHEGEVNALGFASSGGSNLLFSASSSGSIHAYRVGESNGDNKAIVAVETPQWKQLFRRSATSLDVHSAHATLVAASEGGDVAWLRFGEGAFHAQVIRNQESSRLALHGVKMLARETVVATVGAAPGSQLRVWDINANQSFPVATTADPHATCALTSVETHPTRPELLITGSDDGRVALWDLRRLDAPFRVEAKHQRAVRALAVHQTSPRLLFSGGDDATVLAWDFHHGRPASEAVEYEKHVHAQHHGAGLQVRPVASGFLPWRTMDFHAASDTLVAGSDAQSLLLVRHASRVHHTAL